MIQLVPPDLSIIGRVGYCHEYGRKVFGAPAIEDNAWEGWLATKYKHLDRNLPNVAVPVWFSYLDLGHVVIWVPGVGFYSSPYSYGLTKYQATTGHAVLPSIEEVEQKYTTHDANGKAQPVKFVGWSEDISTVRVAKGENMPYVEQYVIDDYEKWKKMGIFLSNQPAYEAMGGKPGEPLVDPSGIGAVLKAYEGIKQSANKKFVPVNEQLYREG